MITAHEGFSIVSSKVSTVDPSDIPRIVQLARAKCNKRCLARRLRREDTIPALAVGIANGHDLRRALAAGVPIVHVQRDCQALKEAQHNHWQRVHGWRVAEGVFTAVAWGLVVGQTSKQSNSNSKRDWLRQACSVALTLYAVGWAWRGRLDYRMVEDEEAFLVRDDLARSRMRTALERWLPCVAVACCTSWAVISHK
ncbi:hypothetical protein BCR43DRAFT_492824 [Syncephalastrum racemosum]|uniref:Uncharacterized protein n=1 Tax=Syncephalastrum racemosum TaxID=13706 RepID=A0A1X2H9K0_SYNRA|nr:hypothetical protein BCR43DRAFT_492824 [Syncephalastrum racemosum]